MFKSKVLKDSDVAVYSMPAIEEETPQSRELMLKSIKDDQQRAYEEGFAAGEKAGFQEGEKKAGILIDRLAKIIEEIESFRVEQAKVMEKNIVDLSLLIAEKVVFEEIKSRPEIMVNIVKEAMKRMQRIGTITIKINPALHEMFLKRKPELADIHEGIVFDVSQNIPLTGPLVSSQTEEVVTDIKSMILNIEEKMKADTDDSTD